MKVTATLYDFIESELIKQGNNEFVSDGELVLFDDEFSFMKRMMKYDDTVSDIVDERFFIGQKLQDEEADKKFKQGFLNRFLDRQINRQTLEAFATQVVYVFISNEDYLNRLYSDLDQYLLNKQVNTQDDSSTNTTDNRSAFAELPQNNVQLDVDSTKMDYANDNTISRNKQTNKQNSSSESSQYRLDDLLKINGLIELIYDKFDEKCFLQIW